MKALEGAKGMESIDLTELIALFGHESFRNEYVKLVESKEFYKWKAGLHGVILAGDVRCAKMLIDRMSNEEFSGQVSKVMTRHGKKSEPLALALLKQPGGRLQLCSLSTKPHQFANFSDCCTNCSEVLFVEESDRAGLSCCKCGVNNGPWPNQLSAQLIPAIDSDTETIIRFSNLFNPLPHFQAMWNDRYTACVSELVDRCNASFQSNVDPPANVMELLMCLQYQVAWGGFRPSERGDFDRFDRWIIQQLHSKLNLP